MDDVNKTVSRTDHGVVSLGRLSICAILWDFADVKRKITIRGLLAILTVAALALAPLSRPVMAGTSSDASMADDMSVSATADGIANDMPCCPAKAPIDCGKCVFMAACMTKCFSGLSSAIFCPPFAASGQIALLQSDFWPDSLGYSPPEPPPRTLV